MSREDIRKLLGGYATGTLTAEEQQALFEAALDDQELFDALAKEQSLRDLLGDPAARAQLLAALDDGPLPGRWGRRFRLPTGPALGAVALGPCRGRGRGGLFSDGWRVCGVAVPRPAQAYSDCRDGAPEHRGARIGASGKAAAGHPPRVPSRGRNEEARSGRDGRTRSAAGGRSAPARAGESAFARVAPLPPPPAPKLDQVAAAAGVRRRRPDDDGCRRGRLRSS